jgi:hypothetical protein
MYPLSCTLRCAPPEAVNAHTTGAEFVEKASLDIWAIGAILFENRTGGPAFYGYGGGKKVAMSAQKESGHARGRCQMRSSWTAGASPALEIVAFPAVVVQETRTHV